MDIDVWVQSHGKCKELAETRSSSNANKLKKWALNIVDI